MKITIYKCLIIRSPEFIWVLMSLCGSSTSRKASPANGNWTSQVLNMMALLLNGNPFGKVKAHLSLSMRYHLIKWVSAKSFELQLNPFRFCYRTLWAVSAAMSTTLIAYPGLRSTQWMLIKWAHGIMFARTSPSIKLSRPRTSTAARPTPSGLQPLLLLTAASLAKATAMTSCM